MRRFFVSSGSLSIKRSSRSCPHCNKKECKKREFGIGQGSVSDLDYEELVQYNSDESAYYEWKVNGIILTFKDELELIQQEAFRRQCMRKLHVLPQKLKHDTWTNIVNNSLESMVSKDIEESSDISPSAMLRIHLKNFLIGRPLAVNREQLLMGKVYYSERHFAYLFRKEDLHKYLIADMKFTLLSTSDIQRKLRQWNHGGDTGKVIKIKGKSLRVTSIPFDFITEEDKIELKDEDLEVKFDEFNKDPF